MTDYRVSVTFDAQSQGLSTALAKAKADTVGLADGLKGVDAAMGQASRAATGLAATAGPAARGLASEFNQAAASSTSLATCLFGSQVAANAFSKAMEVMKEVARQVVDSFLQMEKATRSMQYATGDGEAGMRFVRKTAADLGLELNSSALAFAKLAAAAKGTALQGQATQDIFKAVASASTVMGLSADETSGALMAISQMISKGTVAAEELRGQLGERLPGAFQIAARAMGVSTQELGKMLEQGKVVADDFLPRFAAELQRSLGDAPKEAATGLQSALNRLSTAWTEFLLAVGRSGVIDGVRSAVEGLTAGLRGLAQSGVLRTVGDLLGNTVVQATALGVVINIVLWPAIVTKLIPAMQTLVLTMAIAGPVQGATLALGSLGRAAMGIVGPWGLAAIAIAGVGFGLSRWAQSYSRAAADRAAADAQMRSEATESTRAFVDHRNRAVELEATLRNTSAGTKAHAQAQQQLNGIARQAIAQYPDLVGWLRKENGEYTNLSEGMEKYAKTKLKILQIQLDAERDAVTRAKNEAIDAEDFGSGIRKWSGYGFAQWALVGRGVADSARQEADSRQKSVKAIEQQIAMLKAWDSGKPAPGPSTPGKAKGEVFGAPEIEARLAAIRAGSEEKVTLEQQRQAALDRAKVEYLQEAARLEKEIREGKFRGNQAGAESLLEANHQRMKTKEAAIDREFADKRLQMEFDLQAKLQAGEEGGLQQRLEAVRKTYDKLRQEANILRTAEMTDADMAARFEDISRSEQAARERARQDQVRSDLGKLKQELAELAQMKGHALSFQEQEEVLARFAARSKEAAEAVQRLREELHLNGSATQGWFAGIKDWLGQAGNAFQTFKQLASSVMNGVEQSFSRAVSGLLMGQMSLGQAFRAVWQGIAQTVAQAVGQMIARWAAMAIAKKLLGIQENASDGSRTAASLVSATAETWAAYAGIPFAGPVLAAAQIATMYGSMAASTGLATSAGAKVTAMAVGSRVDNPTLALIGEAGPEVVAPERSFLDWARHIFGMGANLQANVHRNDRLSSAYLSQGASYSARAAESLQGDQSLLAGGAGSLTIKIEQNAPVWDPSQRGLRGMAENFVDSVRTLERERSVVLRPGTAVFGSI